jgi:hypothetical protein
MVFALVATAVLPLWQLAQRFASGLGKGIGPTPLCMAPLPWQLSQPSAGVLWGELLWYWATIVSPVRASVTLLWHWIHLLSPTFTSGATDPSLLPDPQPEKAVARSDKASVAKKCLAMELMLSPPSFVWLVGQ